MRPHLFLATIILLIFISIPQLLCQENEQYTTCQDSFRCANIENVSYPFWGGNQPDHCGDRDFQLDCSQQDVALITIGPVSYRVLRLDVQTQSLTLARADLWTNTCPRFFYNSTFDPTGPFSISPVDQPLLALYYGCTLFPSFPGQELIQIPSQFNCTVDGTVSTLSYARLAGGLDPNLNFSIPVTCSNSITVPVNVTMGQILGNISRITDNLVPAVTSGFTVEWTGNENSCNRCLGSGGRCGSNTDSNSFACYCPIGVFDERCNTTSSQNDSRGSNSELQVVLPVVGAILAGIGIGWLFFFCRQRRRRRQAAAKTALTAVSESKELTTSLSSKDVSSDTTSSKFSRSVPSYPSTTEFGKASTYFGVQVFSYAELEEATDNFDSSRELGDGGFGTVYYAKLADGREVAVKRLYENNFKRVEQFMNEVEILTRLNHEYLVKLYGCTSKRSRELLLVYEYIPNGTVADHLHGKQANSGLLTWPIRLNIAIETADALAYLHRSEIIHRDVKTNNILLDTEFCVKVADFGLSRLFPMDQTHVSTAPQGTPGYVDPEYYQCYQLTEKSDVYSFGVVLVELISSLQAVDTNRHRHDINLANMAVNKIQNHALDELVDPALGFKTDVAVKRMTTLVAELAFRCLQQERDMRPSMKEVLDTLKGILKEELDNQKAEVVDIVIDDSMPLKSNTSPNSPDSVVTEKWVSSSAPNSSG